VAKRTTFLDPILGPLTDDRLTRDVRVFQRAKGHRFSSDDVTTAYIAVREMPLATHVLDLGCGLGSVLLHLAWSLPNTNLVGVEAQENSFELLRRNVERSGFSSRIRIFHNDLRHPLPLEPVEQPFDLITGTPPYFPPNTALDAEDKQRAYARVEYRGGVESYLSTASCWLAPHGTFVLCADARATQRIDVAAQQFRLHIRHRYDAIPKAGKPPLFSIWVLQSAPTSAPLASTLVLRDVDGNTTNDAKALRAFSGF
jgi:tRNA1(Val) A37 N6-methylase TrmN6